VSGVGAEVKETTMPGKSDRTRQTPFDVKKPAPKRYHFSRSKLSDRVRSIVQEISEVEPDNVTPSRMKSLHCEWEDMLDVLADDMLEEK
jgi:hypothetical protein